MTTDTAIQQPDTAPVIAAPATAPVIAAPATAVVPYFAPAALPSDWRTQLVRDDAPDRDKVVSRLERFKDPFSIVDALIESQNKIRSGEVSRGLPDNPTPEQVTAWRDANDVPATPVEYSYTPSDDLVLGEADTRILGAVYPIAHEAGVSRKAMQAMTQAFLSGRDAEEKALLAQDGVDSQTATRQLRETWGNDYTRNLNLVHSVLTRLPESIRDAVKDARLPDGKALMNSPEVIVWLSDLQMNIDPLATVLPGNDTSIRTLTDEIAMLEKKMGTPEWYKDVAAQKRYMELVEVRSKLK